MAAFDDKWHLSPCYSVSHALPAVTGLDDNLAQRLIGYLLRCQRMDGGWGHYGHSTLEETAHCSLALAEAYQAGLLTDLTPLAKANGYLKTNEDETPLESFWIGKTIFRPTKIVEASLFAARHALGQLGLAAVGQELAEVAMINKLAAEGRYDLARPTLIHSRNGNTATELPTVPTNGRNGHGLVNGNNVLQSTSLSLYRLHYHIFLKPKRVDFIVDDVAQLIDETLREISEAYEWQLGKLCVEPGYVQLALSIQPTYSIEEVVGILKFISQRELIAAFPKGGSDLCAGELWSEGYMVASNGAPPSFEELETFLGRNGYQ